MKQPSALTTGLADFLAGQHFGDGVGQAALVELRLDVAGAGLEAVLIVDAAPIADHAGRDRAGRLPECGPRRRWSAISLLLSLSIGKGISWTRANAPISVSESCMVGVDAQEHDALLFEFGGQVLQPRGIGLGQRALGAQEGQHDQLALVVVERVRLAVKVGEREVLDLLADRRAGGIDGDGQRTAARNSPPQDWRARISKISPSSHLVCGG